MTSKDENLLEFDTVVRRFSEAEEALTKIKDSLAVLGKFEEKEKLATEGLENASQQVSEFVRATTDSLDELQSAQEKVVEILKLGSDLLDGTELKSISASVSSLDGKVDDLTPLINDVDKNTKGLKQQHSGLETHSKEIKKELVTLTETLTQLEEKLERVLTLSNSISNNQVSIIEALETIEIKVDKSIVASETPVIVKRLF